MSAKIPITFRVASIILISSLAVFGLHSCYRSYIYDQGTGASISDLRRVFDKAGPQISATFTNSLIQKFPFDGPISWQLAFLKEPLLTLTGRVDTNALHRFISDHAATRFLWSGAGNEHEEGWPSGTDYPATKWTDIWFKTEWVVDGYAAVIEGTIDFQSCTARIRSFGSDQPVSTTK